MTISAQYNEHQDSHKYRVVVDIVSSLLLLLFLYTALSKLTAYDAFVAALKEIPLIGSYAGTIAWLLPVSEFVIATLLFFPGTRLIGLFVSFAMLLFFTGYLLYMIVYMPHLPCNCGGVLNSLSWKQHVLFNLFFLLINIWALLIYTRMEASKKRAPT